METTNKTNGEHPWREALEGTVQKMGGRIEFLEERAAKLEKALRQCYDHLGWNPAKIPAYVAEDARALLEEKAA